MITLYRLSLCLCLVLIPTHAGLLSVLRWWGKRCRCGISKTNQCTVILCSSLCRGHNLHVLFTQTSWKSLLGAAVAPLHSSRYWAHVHCSVLLSPALVKHKENNFGPWCVWNWIWTGTLVEAQEDLRAAGSVALYIEPNLQGKGDDYFP